MISFGGASRAPLPLTLRSARPAQTRQAVTSTTDTPEKPAAGHMHILVIEDDRQIADQLAKGLKEAAHTVDLAFDGDEGLRAARDKRFDVLIVDRMMQGRDGLSVIEQLRKEGIKTPAIILSAMSDVEHRVEGLGRGADDYMTKPFAFTELYARIQAVVRRSNPIQAATRLNVGDLQLDLLTRKVFRGGQEIILQPREFRLLEYLMKHAGVVVTRTMLLEHVWEYHFDPQTNVIDVHISRLRSKIDKSFETPMLQTVRGSGYKLSAPDQ